MKKVPIVIITGFGDGELHTNARALGAAVVLDKPFELDTLRCNSAPPMPARR